MSSLLFFASEVPFRERPNPHEKLLSIHEALSLGITIPEYLLHGDFDRDKPDMLLYMDREVDINVDTKEIEDGDFDDDFAIWPFSSMEVFGIHTEKPCCAKLEWIRYTAGRAENVIAYIREHLREAETVEIWHVWLDDGEMPAFRRKEILLSELTAEVLQEIEELPVTFEPLVHYCYAIKKG